MLEAHRSRSNCGLRGQRHRRYLSQCESHTRFPVSCHSSPRPRETIALEEPDSFFPLLDSLANPETQPDTAPASAEAAHKYAFDTALSAGFLSKPGAYGSAESNLALHAATPKIEARYQYYADRHAARRDAIENTHCGSWVDWYGEIVCDAEKLARLVGVDTIDPPDSIKVEE